MGVCLNVSTFVQRDVFQHERRKLYADRHLLPSNVVLTLSNGGKAGTIYMLLVAICGLFFVCICRLE